MSQIIYKNSSAGMEKLALPNETETVIQEIKWGKVDCLFTPAFWVSQAWFQGTNLNKSTFKIGETLAEEIAACLLGGYGIPAEIGLLAFKRLKSEGILNSPTSSNHIKYYLEKSFNYNNRNVRYRFSKQKSEYLSSALSFIYSESSPNNSPLNFRNWLLNIPGIGLKTASWITRNWLNSDLVAIIDIHIQRAGVIMGIFNENQNPSNEYLYMEDEFLNFATAINIPASYLDGLIWNHMKLLNGTARKICSTIISKKRR